MRIGWLIALASGILDCGARTGIDLETADGSIFVPGGGIGANGGGGAPAACPRCTTAPSCSGPYSCIESDGCTYGWCTSAGFETNSSLCHQEYAASGFCAANGATYVCANPMLDPEGPVPTACLWPPRGDPGEACIGRTSAGQGCGHVRCGPGCTCLCENVCWCGG